MAKKMGAWGYLRSELDWPRPSLREAWRFLGPGRFLRCAWLGATLAFRPLTAEELRVELAAIRNRSDG